MSEQIQATAGGHTLELRHIEVSEFLSEETTAFAAEVFIDGLRAGSVRNDGHSGGNFPHINAESMAAYKEFEEAVKKKPYHTVSHGRTLSWDYDMSFLIGMMVESAWYDDKETYTL